MPVILEKHRYTIQYTPREHENYSQGDVSCRKNQIFGPEDREIKVSEPDQLRTSHTFDPLTALVSVLTGGVLVMARCRRVRVLRHPYVALRRTIADSSGPNDRQMLRQTVRQCGDLLETHRRRAAARRQMEILMPHQASTSGVNRTERKPVPRTALQIRRQLPSKQHLMLPHGCHAQYDQL